MGTVPEIQQTIGCLLLTKSGSLSYTTQCLVQLVLQLPYVNLMLRVQLQQPPLLGSQLFTDCSRSAGGDKALNRQRGVADSGCKGQVKWRFTRACTEIAELLE